VAPQVPPPPFYLYTQIPLLPVINKMGGGGARERGGEKREEGQDAYFIILPVRWYWSYRTTGYYTGQQGNFIYTENFYMLLLLLLVPLVGIFIISSRSFATADLHSAEMKFIGLATTIVSLLISLVVWVLFDFSSNQFQFVQECYGSSQYSIYLGVDGISIYFVLLTTLIMPIALLSN